MDEKILDFSVTNGKNVIYEQIVDYESLVNIEIRQSQKQSVKAELGAFGKDPVRVL